MKIRQRKVTDPGGRAPESEPLSKIGRIVQRPRRKFRAAGLSGHAPRGCVQSILLVAALVAPRLSVHAGTFTEWQFRQEFQVASPGLLKVSLPPDTLDATRSDLADVRVADAAGNEVPYLFQHPAPAGKVVRNAKSFRVELGQDATTITVETGMARPLGGLTLITPATSFIKAASVAGSADGEAWQPLVSGQPIFHQPDGAARLRIELPARAWGFLRLTIDDRASQPEPFTGAQVEAATSEPAPTEAVPIRISEGVEEQGETRLVLDLGAAHLRLASLEIESSDALFRRQVSIATRQVEENTVHQKNLATDTIYRVAVPGQPASARLSLPLEVQAPTRELLLMIQNGDSPPLQITGIRAQRRPVYLVFLAPNAGAFQFFMGNLRCGAPRYDLASQPIDLAMAPLVPIRPGPVVPNPAYRSPETLPQVQETGAALDVSEWRFRKSVTLQRPGVQQLELDLEVLARAQPNLGDLRLLRDGRQLPFITERTSALRPLSPASQRADDPRRSRFSRWSLKLPLPNLPLSRLTCASSTPLFRREVALYEEPTDDRGAKYRRDLGEASWVQSPDRAARTFVLNLKVTPITDTVFLEINNQDNPAIELANFEFAWPVTRLFFKAASAGRVSLYYGNPGASPPHYDLSLAAGQLLTAEKQAAALGEQEQLKKGPWAERQIPGKGGVLFWGALGLVVVALFVIIAKLMPKQSLPSGNGKQ